MVKVRGKEVLGFDDDGDDVTLFKEGGKEVSVFDGGDGDGEHIALVKLRVSYCDFTITAVIPIL